jgi:uncharacterized membrane protein YuzA (DUF378 family)
MASEALFEFVAFLFLGVGPKLTSMLMILLGYCGLIRVIGES